MSKVSSIMNIGARSMANSQTALQTVSHNIANKDTDGFSRQRTEVVSTVPVGEQGVQIGTGSKTKAVRRINNPFLERQIQKETIELGLGESKSENMTRVEQIFNEQINKGLNRFVGALFNSFRELANNPESLATRTLVKENADFLAQDFSRVSRQLKAIQGDIDHQIVSEIAEINEITSELAALNQRVQAVELGGAPANDERDRRDLLLKKLGEKVDIRWAESDKGQISVTAGRTAVLISGFDAAILETSSTGAREGKREGNLDIYFKAHETSSRHLVTEQFTKGRLGGALDVRDEVINKILGNIDKMAYTVSTKINEAHKMGFNIYNQQGVKFFGDLHQIEGSAEKMRVTDYIKENVGRISAAGAPNAPGDNRTANIIADIQNQRFLDDGSSTIDDYYNSLVGKVAVWTRKANTIAEHQENVVSQLQNFRESISGVSLDEEAVKLLKFQKTFDASARLIRAADEMMETVLNLKRL